MAPRAAKKATGTIPIVMVAGDPVGLGLVTNLARPEGNVTALSYLNEEISGKRLELLKELLPALARVAVLRNPNAQSHATFWNETEVAARKLGVTLLALDIRGPDDFEAVFAPGKRGNALARVPNGAAATTASLSGTLGKLRLISPRLMPLRTGYQRC